MTKEQLALQFLSWAVADAYEEPTGGYYVGDEGWVACYDDAELLEAAVGEAERVIELAEKAREFLEALRAA